MAQGGRHQNGAPRHGDVPAFLLAQSQKEHFRWGENVDSDKKKEIKATNVRRRGVGGRGA